MNGDRFDVVVVGGGPGGYPAAIRASQLGLKVAIVEKYKMGGTCLHWGCIPTKVILESAEVYHLATNGQQYGVSAKEVTLDYGQVSQRRVKVLSQNEKGTEYLMKKNNVTLYKGEAKFTSPTTLSIQMADGSGTKEVIATDFIIATGSVPKSLPGLNVDGNRVINSDTAVTMPEVPNSVVILGAGAIGMEFASGWKDLGADVTIVEVLPRVLPLEDPEVSDEMGRLFSRRGIKVMAGTKVVIESVRPFADHVELEVEKDGARQKLSADRLLVATGRAPVSTNLGLEALGVKIERGFIQVDGQMKTNVPHLYAIGDVVGGLMLAHKAKAEGILAAEAIAGQNPHPIDFNRIPRCTYTRPQVGSIGMSEEEAKNKGHQPKVGKFPFRVNAMANILGEADGFAKIVSDAETQEILGVHLVGPRVTELIYGPALARLLESTTEELALNIYPHPTLSEALGEASLAIEGATIDM
jgi:dihydrolipoamide dehydrogenase